jgi:adenylate cyclase
MFSAPVPQADHQQRAYDCALEMQRYAADFAARQQAAGTAFGHTRIGVHSGEVIVGNFGGSTMFDYRALGDAVNTAARLEGANKYLGTRVCISARTLSGCQGAVARRVARVVLKGKSEPLLVYNPLHDGLEGEVDDAYVQRYEAAYESMAADQPQALAMFEALAVEDAADPLVQLHLKRLRAREHDGKGDAGDLIVLADK